VKVYQLDNIKKRLKGEVYCFKSEYCHLKVLLISPINKCCEIMHSLGGGHLAPVLRGNGLLVPPGDVKALEDSLYVLMQDGGLRSNLGKEAIKVRKRLAIQ
tara:strand:- start:170 stop:472 length:303 start_codon:yes stop_codon:yes gene_type:complete